MKDCVCMFGSENTYQFSLQVVWHVGQCSQKRPMLLGSVHSHLPQTHVPLPLHTWPLGLTQCWADVDGHWHRSPSQPLKHRHLPASHSPCPATKTPQTCYGGHGLCKRFQTWIPLPAPWKHTASQGNGNSLIVYLSERNNARTQGCLFLKPSYCRDSPETAVWCGQSWSLACCSGCPTTWRSAHIRF